MIGFAVLAALAGADWQPLELETFRAPPSMFFCKGNEAGAGLFTVFLRHNREESVIDVTRSHEGGAAQLKDRLRDVATREPGSGGIEIRMPVASGSDHAEVVLTLGNGPEKATVIWSTAKANYSAACTSAPVPPGRTE